MNKLELLNIAASSLANFESGKIPLHQLVNELRILQDSVDNVANEWLAEFDRLRHILVEVNALRLDEETSIPDLHNSLVNETIKKLQLLVKAGGTVGD